MARRPGAGGDRHMLLSSTALPASSLYPRNNASASGSGSGSGMAAHTNGSMGGANGTYRTASPFEQPYSGRNQAGGIDTSDPYAEYGAPKKEVPAHAAYGGYGGYGGTGSSYGYGGAAASLGGGTLGAGPGGGLYSSGAFDEGSSKTTGQKIGQLFGLQTADQLEEANDERLEGLTARVRLLKDITVGIGNEVRDSTKDLNSLSEAFNNTSAFLGNTFTRMNRMARRQGGWFCNMMMFLLLVIWIFIFLWWWRR